MSLPKNLPAELAWLHMECVAFSPATAQRLQHFVYMLLHPDDGRIFYVGEGQGQRAFDHVLRAVQLMTAGSRQAIADNELDPEHSEKLGTIANILKTRRLPLMHIVRDGMATQDEAQRVEGALIDVLDYLGSLNQVVPPLTNLQSRHGVASFWTVDDVEAVHGSGFNLADLPGLAHGERVLFVNLNRRWGEVKAGHKSLLDVTRGWWRLAPQKAEACRYVVAHAWGIVRGVFLVDGWTAPDNERRLAFHSGTPDGLAGAMFRDRNVGPAIGQGFSESGQVRAL